MGSVPQNNGASSSFVSCHFALASYSPACLFLLVFFTISSEIVANGNWTMPKYYCSNNNKKEKSKERKDIRKNMDTYPPKDACFHVLLHKELSDRHSKFDNT